MDSILLIEDREGLRKVYAEFLKDLGYAVKETNSAEEGRKVLERHEFSLILTDYLLPGTNGLEFLKQLKEEDPDHLVIIMTAFGEVKLAVAAMKAGAYDFLEKPIDLEYLKLTLSRALNHRELARARSFSAARQGNGVRIVGSSTELQEVLDLSLKVAPTNANCLLLGESGVGKELFARFIHERSGRARAPLVSINCASIPHELMESELFGHEKGAFTGAVAKKAGLLEMADGGTLFLDEIGELPLELQPKLLRAIQTHEFFRVGGGRMLKSDFRLVCATNRNLKKGVERGWFREDLYYRLAVFPIEIPPLRQRLEDVEPLCAFLLHKLRHPRDRLEAGLLDLLKSYNWPGNVRELENVLERAVILSQGHPLHLRHFPEDLFRGRNRLSFKVDIELGQPFKKTLARLEKEIEAHLIRYWLREERGHRNAVAGRLGFSVKTLYNKMNAYGIDPDEDES